MTELPASPLPERRTWRRQLLLASAAGLVTTSIAILADWIAYRRAFTDLDPQAWLSDVLARINEHKINDLAALLPWNWRKPMPSRVEAT